MSRFAYALFLLALGGCKADETILESSPRSEVDPADSEPAVAQHDSEVSERCPTQNPIWGAESRFDSTQGTTIEADELVLGSQLVGDHRCVYAISDRGTLAAGFVRAEHLERVPDPPRPPLEQLVGYWADEGWDPSTRADCVPDHFAIARDPQGTFVLQGDASWCCGCDEYSMHIGSVAGSIDSCERRRRRRGRRLPIGVRATRAVFDGLGRHVVRRC